jgi:ribosome maturation factor RimP
LRGRLGPGLAAAGFDLEDVTVARAGSRSVVRVVVDRDGGIDLDAVADASRIVSGLLDPDGDDAGGESADGGEGGGSTGASTRAPLSGPYVLEVTSPGVDRPLSEPRHWRRATGRLVAVRRADGAEVEGRVLSADDEGADLAVPTGPARRGRPVRKRVERITYGEVARATVQVEFGSATEDATEDEAGTGGPATDSDPATPPESAPESDRAMEDHDAVHQEAGRVGPTGKEMNR